MSWRAVPGVGSVPVRCRYEEYIREGMACNGTAVFPVKGAVLGDNEYRQEIERHLQDMPIDRDVPIEQKTMARPLLGEIFSNIKDRRERNRLIYEAWHNYRYTQKEIAAFQVVHYSLVSRIVGVEKQKSVVSKV